MTAAQRGAVSSITATGAAFSSRSATGRRGRGALLCSARGTRLGGVTQANWPPANPGRFSAGLVLGRTIVRDTAASREAAQRLALMNLMVTIGPAIAPLLGSALVSTLGWRSIFFLLCAFGVANLIFAWRLLPETGPTTSNANGAAFLRHCLQLLGSPTFLGCTIGGGCATTAMYAFIAAAPFIFVNQLHRPPHEAGIYLAALVSGVWLGSALAIRLIARVAMVRLLIRANMMSVLAAFVLLSAVLTAHLTVALALGCMFVFTVGVGIAGPPALTQAISVNPRVIGSASGLYGFTQMAVGRLCTALAGLGHDPALAAASVLAMAGLVGQLSFWTALRWQRRS